MKKTASDAKYQVVRNALEEAIRKGDFRTGERLPSERRLATQFGVSHMTARHAVTDLVESELLERRPRAGIFVRPQTREKLSNLTLNLICSPEDSSITRAFLHLGAREAERRNWRTRITRLHHGYERSIVRAVRSGEPSLVFLGVAASSTALLEAMEHAAGRAALVGTRMHERGIPSVQADDNRAIQMAVKRLQKAGHRQIALVSGPPDAPIVSTQINAWRGACADQDETVLQQRLIVIETGSPTLRVECAYQAVSRYFASRTADVTALIGLDDEATLGALAACHDAGLPVPNALSLVNIGDSALLQFARPSAITAIDINMKKHVEAALHMIEAALASTLNRANLLQLIEPRLVERDSVDAPFTTAKSRKIKSF